MNGFHVIIRELPKERGGGFQAEVLEIPGLVVFGVTIEAAKEAVRKRIDSWLGLRRRLGWEVKVNFDLQMQNDSIRSLEAV